MFGNPQPEPLNTPEFYEERKTSLIVLLQKHSAPYAVECIADIRQGKLLPPYRFAAPLQETMDKYARDLQLKKEMNSPIFGYEELMANLEKLDENAVNIHLVEGENYTFDILTDPANEHLYGLVAFDESTEWRGYPRPHLQDHCDWDIYEVVSQQPS